MFIKLNKSIHILEYTIGEYVISYTDRISYSEVLTSLNDIFDLVPERYQKDFVVRFMEITDSIPPHTDSGILSTINIYIQPDNCKTTFYKVITDTPNTVQVANQTNGKIFNIDSLIEAGFFIAEKDDVWLLDVSIPHSVTSSNPSIHRLAVCLQSKIHNADSVKSMLLETNYI